uniref:C-CAP/cofactor C-like domain-containing protein n=1 Tax=Ananas comosus var. bracteatus TaxID=296719 RepID=A0A6V7PKP1_ANACO|nr:unnamed protein product [Ananas comosus var. bracteatus]
MRAGASGRAWLVWMSGREQGQAGERVLGRQRGAASRRGRAPARTGDASWRGENSVKLPEVSVSNKLEGFRAKQELNHTRVFEIVDPDGGAGATLLLGGECSEATLDNIVDVGEVTGNGVVVGAFEEVNGAATEDVAGEGEVGHVGAATGAVDGEEAEGGDGEAADVVVGVGDLLAGLLSGGERGGGAIGCRCELSPFEAQHYVSDLRAWSNHDAESCSSGLRKVTDDMKSKNRSDTAGVVSASEKETVSGRSSISKRSTPKFELQMGRKWAVENQVGEKNLVIDDCDAKQSVYVYGCKDSVLQVKGKVNNITIDKCTKMGILFKDIVAACEIVNCNSVEVQCEGSAPTISIDNTSGCQLYLGKDSLETSITIAKSSEVNVLVSGAGPDGDWAEHPLPQQFVHTFRDGQFTTSPVSHSGGLSATNALLQAHPWFNGTQWDKLYQMEAAFKPEVTGELDTQNFEKFEETAAPMQTSSKSGPWRKLHAEKLSELKDHLKELEADLGEFLAGHFSALFWLFCLRKSLLIS